MSDQRFIIEMGMGNDMHGEDYTKAAIRAVEDAFRHSCLPMFEALEIGHDRMRVQVTVAVQNPEAVDRQAVAAHLPRGRVEVRVVKGGLNVTGAACARIVVATAAVEAFLPSQAAGWRLDRD